MISYQRLVFTKLYHVKQHSYAQNHNVQHRTYMQLSSFIEAEWRIYASVNYAIIGSGSGLSQIGIEPLSDPMRLIVNWTLGNTFFTEFNVSMITAYQVGVLHVIVDDIVITQSTPRCYHICQHIEMLAHSTSGDNYADICVNTFVLVLTNMMTCSDADIYADTLRCWHII